jgi:hypothetical protein
MLMLLMACSSSMFSVYMSWLVSLQLASLALLEVPGSGMACWMVSRFALVDFSVWVE